MPSNDHRGLGSKVVELSEEMSGGLNIFEAPPKDTSILSGKTVVHHLSTAINENTTVFEFVVPAENHEYIYLPMTRIEGEIEIKKKDNTAIVGADQMTTVNQFATSFFKQVECEINGVQVADLTSPTYHYKAFLEHELTYCNDVKETVSRCLFYHWERAGKEEDLTDDGLLNRRGYIIDGKGSVHFSAPIYLDFFDSARYLIPGAVIKLRFIRNPDTMCFIATTDDYKAVVKSLKLTTRKLTVHPAIVEQHREIIQKQPAVYPIAQSKIKTYGISQGQSSATLSGIFMGKLPRFALIGFVKSDAFNGTISTNPFVFKHFNVNYVGLTVNGLPMPSTVLQPDFESQNCIREYRHFLDNLGVATDNAGFNICFNRFLNNMSLFTYDFSPDLCNNYHDHPDNSGYVSLDLRFAKPLPTNITVIVYATYNESLLIDRDGNVTLVQ